jgi:hypothetical protein
MNRWIEIVKNAFGNLICKLTKRHQGGNPLKRWRYESLGCQNSDKSSGKNTLSQRSFLHLLKSVFDRKNFKSIDNRGSILVEFAIGVPILIPIMLYGHDIFKLARIRERIEFCTYCGINMIQNISQGRENQRITRTDIMTIAHAMWLPFFGGGINQYSTTAPTTSRTYKMPCGYVPQIELYCFKGMGGGMAKLCWMVNANCALGPNPANIDIMSDMRQYSPIKTTVGSTYKVSDIRNGLAINENEIKIIALSRFCMNGASPTDGKNFSLSQRLGLLIIRIGGELSGTYLHTVVIFTPKPRLFSETPP